METYTASAKNPGEKIVLYTVILGGYDALRPTRWPAVCLTDGSVEPAEGWELWRITSVGDGPQRASEHPKILPWVYFPSAEYSIYHDGNLEFLVEPEEAITRWLRDWDMALFRHPDRDCIYDEAAACILGRKDTTRQILPQMARYQREGLPRHFGLVESSVIIRRHTEQARLFGELWWREVNRHSYRDQLSFDYVRWKTGMGYDVIPGSRLRSPCHRYHPHGGV